MDFNYDALRGRIREKWGTEGAFAAAVGLDRATLSQKLNNKSEFTQKEMCRIMDGLGEDSSKASLYFFTPKVTET